MIKNTDHVNSDGNNGNSGNKNKKDSNHAGFGDSGLFPNEKNGLGTVGTLWLAVAYVTRYQRLLMQEWADYLGD